MLKLKPGMVIPVLPDKNRKNGWQATILVEDVGVMLVEQVFSCPSEAKDNMRKIIEEINSDNDMPEMSIDQYVEWCASWGTKNPAMRPGQHMFNTLHERFPEIANQVRETDCDPFYNDERIPEFLKFVQSFIKYES